MVHWFFFLVFEVEKPRKSCFASQDLLSLYFNLKLTVPIQPNCLPVLKTSRTILTGQKHSQLQFGQERQLKKQSPFSEIRKKLSVEERLLPGQT